MSGTARFRVLLWLFAISLLGNLILGYFTYQGQLRLWWLEDNLQNTETAFDKLNWTRIDQANQVITDLNGIESLTLPDGWVFAKPAQAGEDLQTLIIKNSIPSDRQSLTWLVGGTITVNALKDYESLDIFLANSREMYGADNPMRNTFSYNEIELDGAKGYRAEGQVENLTTFNIKLTPPTKAAEVAVFSNGYTISFNLTMGNYATAAEITEFTEFFEAILDSVKLAEAA